MECVALLIFLRSEKAWGIHDELRFWWQATPRVDVSPETAKALTERIQDAGTEVVKAKVQCNASLGSSLSVVCSIQDFQVLL